jgi:septum formation protein
MTANPPADSPGLVLASGSAYRRELLERLGLSFEAISPNVDESPGAGEEPAELVTRLAIEKARAVAVDRPDRVIIGSDQVATLDGQILGKPGSADNAVAALTRCSGRSSRKCARTPPASGTCWRPGHEYWCSDRGL